MRPPWPVPPTRPRVEPKAAGASGHKRHFENRGDARRGDPLSRRAAGVLQVFGLALVAVHASSCSSSDPTASSPEPTPDSQASISSDPFEPYEIVDLTHPYDADTLYWPTDTAGFRFESLASGLTEEGYFYSAGSFSTAEHGGTHLDAPVHFAEHGWTTDEIPLERLLVRAVVVDVSSAAELDADYTFTLGELEAWEREHGRVPRGSALLLRTGWSSRWPDAKDYLGDDRPGDASDLHFPSYGDEAARALLERGVAVLGIDTASIDAGTSSSFPVHRVAAAANVVGLENLDALDRLPATGAWLIALPMKIGGGTGAPVRVVAMVPRDAAPDVP